MKWDVAVVGGGIVGMASAMAMLEAYDVRLVVLEAERELGAHQTGRNSGVIHSGLYYRPGSLKAQNCVAGREAMYKFCEEHGIAHERCGKLVVATTRSEIPRLEELEKRGKANGLKGVTRLGPREMKDIEPHVDGVEALWIEETGIVDFREVTNCFARVVSDLGGEVRTGYRVMDVKRMARGFVLITNREEIETSAIVNCAGLQSDRIAKLCGLKPPMRIVPFRGEYYELLPERRDLVSGLIYPVPDPRFPFLGVHFTRTIHGVREAGPNAVLALKREGYTKTSFSARDARESLFYIGFWRLALRYWNTGLEELYRSFSKGAFVRAIKRLIPEIRPEDLVPGPAGVRAQALDRNGNLIDDFVIEEAPGMIHVLNAPSPAATASITIGHEIASRAGRALGLLSKRG